MDMGLSFDAVWSDIGIHVIGGLAAAIAVDFYRSVFSSGKRSQRVESVPETVGSVQTAETGPRRGLFSRLFHWLFWLVFKLVLKAALSLLAAAYAIHWLYGNLDLATAYRLSADAAESLHAVIFFVVFALVWLLLPIRTFRGS